MHKGTVFGTLTQMYDLLLTQCPLKNKAPEYRCPDNGYATKLGLHCYMDATLHGVGHLCNGWQ
jgi:hypothetical protein